MKTLATAILALAFLGVPAVASAKPLTIKADKYQVTRLGSLKTSYGRYYRPTVGNAIKAFGRPSTTFYVNGRRGGCVAKWQNLGLRIEFWNFGAFTGSICDRDNGLAQSFTITDSPKWRTWNGLRIGMPEERIGELHPSAEWVEDEAEAGDGYWLRQQWTAIGDGSFYPILSAHLNGGRVSRFAGWIGAAGE